MPVPAYVRDIRARIGTDLLFLPGVGGVVRNDAGEILLVRRADNGAWSLPSGTVEPGEQPADAVLREINEETGVTAEIVRLAGVAQHPVLYPNGDRCEFLHVWFLCRAVDGVARVNDDESVDVAWFAPDVLPNVTGWVRLRINEALSNADRAWFAPPGTSRSELRDPAAL